MKRKKKAIPERDKRDRRKRRKGELPPFLAGSVLSNEHRGGKGRRIVDLG